MAKTGQEPSMRSLCSSVCSAPLSLHTALYAYCEVFSMLCVSMVLLRCRCVYGAAGAAGCRAVQRGREGVMANIRGKEPLTHGTGIVGLWKIHFNSHSPTHAHSEHEDMHTSHINTQTHTWEEDTWVKGDSLQTQRDSNSNTGLFNTCWRKSLYF